MTRAEDCDCERFGRQIDELLDKELDDFQSSLLRDHARSCPDCASREAAQIHLRSLIRRCLRSQRGQASSQLRTRVLALIHRETIVRLRTSDEVCE